MKIRRFPAVSSAVGCIRCFWYTVEEIGAAGNAASFVWKQTQNLAGSLCWQRESKKREKLWKWLRTEVADNRRLSGIELLSCTRRIFRAPGKAETAHICARGVGRRTQCMCLNPCHKLMSARQTWRHSEAYSLWGGTVAGGIRRNGLRFCHVKLGKRI